MSAPTPQPWGDQGGSQRSRPTIIDSVSIATELWIVVILGQLVTYIGQGRTALDAWPDQVRSSMPDDAPKDQVEALSSTASFLVGYTVVGLILLSVSVALVMLVRRGYGWARIALGAAGVYIAFNTLLSYFARVDPTWVMIPMILSAVAALGASVLLLRSDSDRYCRDMAEFRRTRQQQTLASYAPGFPPSRNVFGSAQTSTPWQTHHRPANPHPGAPVVGPPPQVPPVSSRSAGPDGSTAGGPADERPTETIPVVPPWERFTRGSGESGRHRKTAVNESDEEGSDTGEQT